jgi:sulfur carrier protein
MKVTINGEAAVIEKQSSLRDVIDYFKVQEASIVIELNEQIIKKEAWQSTTIQENDRIELVSFVGGG